MPSGTSIARSVASDVPDSVVKVRFYAFQAVIWTLEDNWPATQDVHIHSHECSNVESVTEGNSHG